MMTRWRPLVMGLTVLGAWASSSCSPAGFQSSTVIDSVRILASRASEPRARPGDTVTLDLLANDGRVNPVGTMGLFWLPIPCVNPPNDAYYACFAQLVAGGGDAGVLLSAGAGTGASASADAGASASADGGASADADGAAGTGADTGADGAAGAGGDAGAGAPAKADAGASAGLAGLLRPGVDLNPLLIAGATATFKVPENIIIARNGVSPSYGLIILFNFACTGHIELLPFDPGNANPQQIPIGCFDSQHNQLGPEDFVFGFTRVYVYQETLETNPVISQVDVGGSRLDIDGGTTAPFVVPLCGADDGGSCPKHAIGPVVGPSAPSGKQVWADFYSTIGTFSSSARLLYDPMVTLSIPSATNNSYLAPNTLRDAPANKVIWIVVHDDQGGADWVTVPLKFE
jgi:hypothetical protein